MILTLAGALAISGVPVWSTESTSNVVLQLEVSRNGEPVGGLSADDFLVRQRGKSLEIVDVLEVAPGVAVENLPESAFRQVLFLFDLELTSTELSAQAAQLAEAFVSDSLRPTDRVAILTHDMDSGLEVVLEPTADRAVIARFLEGLGAARKALITSPPGAGPVVNGETLHNPPGYFEPRPAV